MSRAKAKTEGQTQTFDTRVAHQVLLDGLNNLRAAMEGAPLGRKIEVGSILWELGDRVKDVLNEIKKFVRIDAVAQLEGQVGTCTLEGDDWGEATVNIPEATLRVMKGADIDDLEDVLGNDFSLFFEEVLTIKPRKEFEDRVTSLENALHKQILLNAVQRDEPTPRVSFKRHKSSKRDE